jgi:transcriptional regulator with XRE-family HTH domain
MKKNLISSRKKTAATSGRGKKGDDNNPTDIYVGARMRMRRTLLGLSQEKLAAALGITFQQVQKYERGVNRVGASRLYDLSRILEVPVAFFFDEMEFGGKSKSKLSLASPKAGLAGDELNDRETLELIKAYKSIKNASVRKSVLDMIRSLAKKQSNDNKA